MRISVRHRKLSGGPRQTVYLDYYDHGRRWLEYLGIYLAGTRAGREADRDTLRLAETIAAKRRLEFASEEYGFAHRGKQKGNFIEYCRGIAKGKRAPNTRSIWENAIRHFEAYTHGPIRFQQVTHSRLLGFVEYLKGRLKPNSALTYLVRIKAACHQAVKDGILPRDPALGVTIRKQATRRAFLTLEELEKLAEAPCRDPESKRAFLFSCFCGLRYSDVKNLTWGQVRRSDGRCFLEFEQIKTDEPETQPLAAEAVGILDEQIENLPNRAAPSGPVFKLPAEHVTYYAIRKWVQRAGLEKKISFHGSRHSFATLALTRGVDLYTLSKLLGHRQISTTEIYAKIVDQKKQLAVDLLPRLKRKTGPEGGEGGAQ